MDIQQALKSYGLDAKEAALYVAALEVGESPLSDIAEHAGVKRSTAYAVATSLEQKGLIGSFVMRGRLRYVPAQPKTLLAQAEKKLSDISSVVPQLQAITRKETHKPLVSYFEGKEGYYTVVEDALRVPNTTMYHIGSLKDIWNVIGKEYDMKHFVPTRVKKRIHIRCLYFPREVQQELQTMNDAAELREVRYLPQERFYPNSSLIYGHKVAIFTSVKEFITVLIESAEIAQAERQKFAMVWDTAAKKG